MRKTYAKPTMNDAGNLDEVTRGAGFGFQLDGILFNRPGNGGNGNGGPNGGS